MLQNATFVHRVETPTKKKLGLKGLEGANNVAKYSHFCLKGSGGKNAVIHKLQLSEEQKIVQAAVMRLSPALLAKVTTLSLSVSVCTESAVSSLECVHAMHVIDAVEALSDVVQMLLSHGPKSRRE